MSDTSRLIRTCSIWCIAIMTIFFIGKATFAHLDTRRDTLAKSDITDGIVINHEYTGGTTNIFGVYIEPVYQLEIQGTYKHNGESKLGTKMFTVPVEAYNYFEDGDYFNSATFLKEIAQLKQDSSDTITES